MNIGVYFKEHELVTFLIPLGFDSYISDCTFDHSITVAKGKTLDEVKRSRRFTTDDYTSFYKKLLDLYRENQEKIKAIYISLEGGYDSNVLPHELKILIEKLDTLNQSYYQNLNLQITAHIEEKLWTLVVPKLQRALENNKLSSAERYNLLSKLCYAHVECQQAPEAQRIYQQIKTMEETASEAFITQGDLKTRKRERDPLHHAPQFAKKGSSQSSEAEKVDYLSKLENITTVLLDNHLYSATNLQRLTETLSEKRSSLLIKMARYQMLDQLTFNQIIMLPSQSLSLLINMANYQILNQHTFNQAIDFIDSNKPLFNDYADYLSALEKCMNYIKDNPRNHFKLLTNTHNPSLNIDLIFILHFLTSNGDMRNFQYLQRLISGLNTSKNTLVEAFKYLRLNNIKLDQLIVADINALLNNPINSYKTAVQFCSDRSKIPSRTNPTSESARPLPQDAPGAQADKVGDLSRSVLH